MNMKLPKPVKVILIVFVVYAGLVALFESMLGIFQPERGTTLVITTTDADDDTHDRVLARLDSNDELFVAVNHWPRAWYRRALENPNVQVRLAGQRGDYLADDDTHDRVLARLDSNDELFVAVNHWPRAWYRRALENPNVQVRLAGQRGDYLAVPATDEEHDRLQREHDTGILFHFMVGFAPRYFFRLEPR